MSTHVPDNKVHGEFITPDYVNSLAARANDGVEGTVMELWRNSNLSINSGSLTTLTWDEGAANNAVGASFWNIAAPSIIEFQQTGMFSVVISIAFSTHSTGYRYVNLHKVNYDNGSAASVRMPAVSGQPTLVQVATHLKVNAIGCQVRVQVQQDSGSALNVLSLFDAGTFSPGIMVARVGDHYSFTM